jgi:hypothetical protein
MEIVIVSQPFSKQVGTQFKTFVIAKCHCGKEFEVRKQHLTRQKSCGCIIRKHGHSGKSRTVEYRTWEGIKTRCSDPKYKYYAGRGIKMCPTWENSFETFLADMGSRPPGCSIERIDNNGNYCKENCKWATPKEQGSNKRNNVLLTIYGKTMTLPRWCDVSGVKVDTAYQRLRRGWTDKQAIFGKPSG